MSQPFEPRARRWTLTPTSILIIVGAVFVAFLLRATIEVAHTTIGWVVACSVVAMLIDPVVGFVDRFLPRWLGVIAVVLAMLLVVGGVVIGLANDVIGSLDELQVAAPQAAAGLEANFSWAAEIGVEDRVKTFIDDLNERLRSDAITVASQSVPTYLVTGILMLFILGYGRRYIASFVDQFDPRRRVRMRRVISGSARRSQRYLLVAVGHGVVSGVVAWLVFNLLGLPASLSLAVAVGLFTVLPFVGVLIGGVPALLLAFGLDGWGDGGVVLAALIVLQLIGAVLVRPRLDAASVRLGPTVPIVAGLLGLQLYGAGGAVYAVALAVVGLAALDELGAEPEPEPEPPRLALEVS